MSPENQLYIEKAVAFHLGELKKGFESGELDEDLVENADETHFLFNIDNGRTVGMRGMSTWSMQMSFLVTRESR